MSKTKNTTPVNNSVIVKEKSDFRPMLLALGEIDKMTNFPYILQNKYDGVRCIAIKGSDGIVRLFSRGGNEFNMPHLIPPIQKVFERFSAITHLDGEIYNHDIILQDITGAVKGSDNDKKKDLWYQIYDIPLPETKMENRMSILTLVNEFVKERGLGAFIKCDTGVVCNDATEVDKFYKNSLGGKYEGSVATRADSYYKTDTRSVLKLKLKPLFTDEFTCVSHYYGKGKFAEASTLIVASKEAKELGYASAEVFESFAKTKSEDFIDKYYFHVVMIGSMESKKQMAANFDKDFKNKQITVEYCRLSKNNIPLGGKGLCVRDYE